MVRHLKMWLLFLGYGIDNPHSVLFVVQNYEKI